MKRIALLLIAISAGAVWASGLSALENFVKSSRSGRADFTQVVTSVAKEGQTARTKTSSGTFEFLRPNRFKFVYKKPFEQSIVADGQTLWLYDVDLNQVTARSQAQALGTTPAALIASAADLHALERDFALSEAPPKDGVEWVKATPKAKDGSLHSVRIGFKGGALAALEILDNFGQHSRLTFGTFSVNASVDAATFQFKPPAGADVIRQ